MYCYYVSELYLVTLNDGNLVNFFQRSSSLPVKFAVVSQIAIFTATSDLNWLASVPLLACLDYALPQSSADNAEPSRLLCNFQVCFLSDSLVCQV